MMSDVWRIFVVVGEDTLNQNIVNTLLKDGYAVRGVMSGADAVRVLWSEEYDIIICDLQTPGADGFELLQWLRAYRPNTQMIMLGDANAPTVRMQALESGAVSYFERPVDLRLLREELRRLLQQTGFTASLDSFDLLDVIQIITMGRKSMALLINTGLEERGILCFQNGDLVWAEYGVLRGEEAFFALAAHKNGTVTQQPWNEQIDANVTQPLSRLIFQALQYRTKYADRQQYSGEIESLPSASFSPFSEIDDTPFMVLTEHEAPEQSPFLPRVGGQPDGSQYANPRASIPTEMRDGASNTSPVQASGDRGNVDMNLPLRDAPDHMMFQPDSFSAPSLNDTSLAPTMAIDSSELNALLKRQNELAAPPEPTTSISPSADLPAWLTDQSIISPSQAMFPVDAPHAGSVPFMPATSGDNEQQSGEWFQQPLQATTDQLPDRQGIGSDLSGLQETEILWRSSSEWRSGISSSQDGESQQLSHPLYESQSPTPSQYQSPTPSQYQSPAPSPVQGQTQDYSDIIDRSASGQMGRLARDRDDDPLHSTSSTRVQHAAQRNYPALVNALQTLGYAVPGFIAAALVTVEGHPLAQVVVDDSDMTPIYQYIGTLLTHAVQTLDQSWWGAFEHTVISGRDRHLLVRAISAEKNVFQVLIAARGTDPAVCLETMANLEGSISAALH